ncbi:MAG TPA: hypothetical protein ENN08_06310, partial [Bacteroidales bacterium]|nr:hypothetical protein [Bacteroidales bacterium]
MHDEPNMNRTQSADLIKPMIFSISDLVEWVQAGTPFKNILKLIDDGKNVCLVGTFGFALAFYSWLKKQNDLKFPVKDYKSSRVNRNNFRSLNTRLFIRVRNCELALDKAPKNPWLKQFYPKHDDFLLRFSDFLGMNGAWQWFKKGIKLPVLDQAVHPFYGVYFPNRHEHLILFNHWLAKNAGFSKALDIGTGCGVLALLMLRRGIPFVHATDVNPNAVYNAALEFEKRGMQAKTLIEQASFLGSYEPDGKDLIVINPPWIPAQTETALDLATYYEAGFFEKFFSSVHTEMKKGSTLVLLF